MKDSRNIMGGYSIFLRLTKIFTNKSFWGLSSGRNSPFGCSSNTNTNTDLKVPLDSIFHGRFCHSKMIKN